MKLSYKIIEQQNTAKLTQCEMNMLLELAKKQDESGKVYGVHYLDICKNALISESSFYNAKYGLELKGFIDSEVQEGGYYNITIINNDFSKGKEDYEKGYINLQREVFHKKPFKKLSAHEKLLVLLLLKRTNENSKNKSFKIKPENFYNKFSKILGVTKRVVREYKKNIKGFFSIGFKNGIFFITYKISVFEPKLAKSERYYKDFGYVKYIVRKLKIKGATDYEIDQTTELMHQYRKTCYANDTNIETVMYETVEESVKNTKTQKKRNLKYKLLNKLIHNRFTDYASVKKEFDREEFIKADNEEYERALALI